MKLSYKPIVGVVGYTVLFDETAAASGPVLESFKPNFTPNIQRDKLAGSGREFRAPRGNVFVSHPLPVWITYNTRAAALDSIKDWAALLNQIFHLKVEQDGTVHYYPNAMLTNYTATPGGTTVMHNITFISDTVQTTEP